MKEMKFLLKINFYYLKEKIENYIKNKLPLFKRKK
jgi:hypothetical protein